MREITFEEAYEMLGGEDGNDDFLTSKGSREENFIEGINILAKYPKDFKYQAEHDVLYLSDFSFKMTEEDIRRLNVLGFHLEEETECWAKFT